MYKSIGKLHVFTQWALLECDDEIGRMYRTLYTLEYPYKPQIQKPLWGSHISVIRGETILDENLKQFLPNTIEFSYISCMYTNGVHFWLPVICPILDTIRELFSLPPTLVNYHLSIGNICDGTGQTRPEIFQ